MSARLYSLSGRSVFGRQTLWHVVSRWSGAGGKPRSVCGRALPSTNSTQQSVPREALAGLRVCGNCDRMKDAETA